MPTSDQENLAATFLARAHSYVADTVTGKPIDHTTRLYPQMMSENLGMDVGAPAGSGLAESYKARIMGDNLGGIETMDVETPKVQHDVNNPNDRARSEPYIEIDPHIPGTTGQGPQNV